MSTGLEPQSRRRGGYLGIAYALRQRIAGGELRAGEQLPPITALAAQSGATPITVRRALRHLEEEGLIRVEHGVGTFVADWAAGQDFLHLSGFAAEPAFRDTAAETQLLAREFPVTHAGAAQALELPANAPLAVLIRLRSTGGRPIALQSSYLPAALSGLAETYSAAQSLYECLREQTGRLPLAAQETLQAVALPVEAARCLDAEAGEPGWRSTRITFDSANLPLLYDEAWLAGERVELQIRREPGKAMAVLGLRREAEEETKDDHDAAG